MDFLEAKHELFKAYRMLYLIEVESQISRLWLGGCFIKKQIQENWYLESMESLKMEFVTQEFIRMLDIRTVYQLGLIMLNEQFFVWIF
ncbi:MAG: hypothetical protein PHF31_02075 [Methylobacter sp.]|nr:hypothetical protein [Methylobacter sp.]